MSAIKTGHILSDKNRTAKNPIHVKKFNMYLLTSLLVRMIKLCNYCHQNNSFFFFICFATSLESAQEILLIREQFWNAWGTMCYQGLNLTSYMQNIGPLSYLSGTELALFFPFGFLGHTL